MSLPLPRTNPPTCMIGVPVDSLSKTGHCIEPTSSSRANETPANVGVVAATSSMISEALAYDISS